MIGSLGFQEILLILAVALLIFGPRELPRIGRTIGRTLAEFRKASNDLRRSLNTELLEEELRESDPRKVVRETVDDLKSIATLDDSEPSPAPIERPGSLAASESGEPETASEPGRPAAVARGTVSTPSGS